MTQNRLLLLGALVVTQSTAVGQVVWAQLAASGPSARLFHAMAYDSVRGVTVLFGGSVLGDTWEWDGSTWSQAQPIGGPPARGQHAMAFDSQRGRAVMFGGDAVLGPLQDTWEWDGVAWHLMDSNGPARANHAMAYDSHRGRTVLFGGSWGVRLGDTWEWNGSSWLQAATTGPTPRVWHALAYDARRQRTVLFGGDAGGASGETWEWDGSAWAQAAAIGPARIRHSMAYDSQRGKTILFGGEINNLALGDTWEWDGASWTQVSASGPSVRYLSALVYDSAHAASVLFGGTSDGNTTLGDTWRCSGTQGSAALFGSGCGSLPLALSSLPSSPPTANTVARASLTNLPSSFAFVALGWSRTLVGPFALPFPLSGYGMPGCWMLQSADFAAQPAVLTGPGTAVYELPLPNWTGLVGLHVYLQGWAPAPGANAGGVIVSNGLDWLIGY